MDKTFKDEIVQSVILTIAAIIGMVIFFYWVMTDDKKEQQRQDNICSAICGNDIMIGCESHYKKLKVICMAPETKIARIVEVQQ